jgi:hypothetical protein
MTRARALLFVLALLPACTQKTAQQPHPPSSGGLAAPDAGVPDAAGPDAATLDSGSPEAGGGDDAALADSALGMDATGPGDGSPDGTADAASPQVAAYRQFLDDASMAWRTRWAACFNTAPEALGPERSPLSDDFADPHAYSLDHGLLAFDAGKGRACLEALRTETCPQLAVSQFDRACAVLVGQVATGGFCVSPDDCRLATDSCDQTAQTGCQSHCTTRPPTAALGEACDVQPCATDGVCYVAPGESAPPRCHALDPTGTDCTQETCIAGAWCEPTADSGGPGTCQLIGPGRPCAGGWQCPVPYACLIAPGATAGTCGPGRKAGETCALQGLSMISGPYSDCANGLFCYPDGTGQLTCGIGRDLGNSCGDTDVGGVNPLSIPCRVGSCRPGAGATPVCVLDGKLGDACTDDLACASGFVCDTGKCRDAAVKLGERCTLTGTYLCPPAARCAATPPSTEGTCVALKRAGEPCDDPEACALGLSCSGGTCQPCQ